MLQMCGILQYLNLLIIRLAGGPTVRAADEYAQININKINYIDMVFAPY